MSDPYAVQSMFSSIAPRYDLANTVLSFGLHHLWRRRAIRLSDVGPGDRVLDCATGTGDLALGFKRAVGPLGMVVGVDFCEPMLELAAAQLELSQHLEKLLLLKQELLDAVRNHTKQTLLNLAKVFEKADQDLADTILMQTQAVKTTGSLPKSSMAKEGPSDLKEYREALGEQKERLDQFDARLQTCRDELNGLIEFEEAIFNTYGEQLRERGVQFKKRAKVAKTVSGLGPKKQPAARMVGRNK